MINLKSILLVILFLVSGASYGRHAAILIDADTGGVLHEIDATQAWFPASLTKVMTLYMVFDALNAGQLNLNDTMYASHHAALQPNSKLGLRTGENITVQEAILATITRSANDAAVTLAEHLAGSEENFAARMTAKAHALGMYDSHFMNATGLPHEWQVTTARDMAMLAWRVRRDFPNYYPYFSAHSFSFKGRELRGINKFTANYPGAEGMKTGFTCGSGYNLIGAASQNGKRLIGVILGGMTSPERYQLMFRMMDNGFAYSASSPTMHIASMTTRFTGTPPYQLGCGNKAPANMIATYSPPRHSAPHRFISRSRHTNHKAIHVAKLTGKSRHAAKSRAVIKTASLSKSTRSSKASKTRYRRSG